MLPTTKTIFCAKKPRLPLTQRAPGDKLPPFRLTRRDTAILRAIYEYRALTSVQVQSLLFPSSKEQHTTSVSSRCLHRLKLLFHHGYLHRLEQPQLLSEGRLPFVYSLDTNGADCICAMEGIAQDELDWHPRDTAGGHRFLEHLLATNTVRIAITLAADAHDWTLELWHDDHTLKRTHDKEAVTITGPQGGQQRVAIVPDGYFWLKAGEYDYHHFLEIDMATTTGQSSVWGRRDWAKKIRAYIEYHRSGTYTQRYNTQSMRVLTVTTSQKRLTNLKAITEKIGGKSRFWFTTFDHITTGDILTTPIWEVAGKEGLHTLTW